MARVKLVDQRAKAAFLRAQGLSYRQISEQCGVSLDSVYKWMNDPEVKQVIMRHMAQVGFEVMAGLARNMNKALEVQMRVLNEEELPRDTVATANQFVNAFVSRMADVNLVE